MRALTPILVTVGLVASLAACTGPVQAPVNPDCAGVPSGAASEKVQVSGKFGQAPTVKFTSPLEVEETQRTVVIPGDGDTAEEGDVVNVAFSLLNGTTGVEVSPYDAANQLSFPVDRERILVGIVDTIECSTVGSRVVGVIPAEAAFGADGSAQLGVEPDQNLVFVVDVVSIDPPVTPPLPRADGADQPAPEGFPAVELDADGRPTVTIPDAAPPSGLQLAVLKQGDGAQVKPGDDVVVHYVGMNWASKAIFDESWARGTPASFNTTGVIPGFAAAIEGQKVGSQVIVIIPPELGYGEGTEASNGTILFVVDILGIA